MSVEVYDSTILARVEKSILMVRFEALYAYVVQTLPPSPQISEETSVFPTPPSLF